MCGPTINCYLQLANDCVVHVVSRITAYSVHDGAHKFLLCLGFFFVVSIGGSLVLVVKIL